MWVCRIQSVSSGRAVSFPLISYRYGIVIVYHLVLLFSSSPNINSAIYYKAVEDNSELASQPIKIHKEHTVIQSAIISPIFS